MTELFFLFAASAALAATLAVITVWSPRRLRTKVAAVLTTAMFIPAIYLSYADLLSRPKPVDIEWWNRDAPEATVIGAKLLEGEAIYLWIEMPEQGEPRAYKLPWAQELAKQLYGAQREAQAMGTKVQMRLPFKELTEDYEPVFYALPQPPLPSKNAESDKSRFFRHSSTSSPREGLGGS